MSTSSSSSPTHQHQHPAPPKPTLESLESASLPVPPPRTSTITRNKNTNTTDDNNNNNNPSERPDAQRAIAATASWQPSFSPDDNANEKEEGAGATRAGMGQRRRSSYRREDQKHELMMRGLDNTSSSGFTES